jgi:hypothetical protein
MSLAPQCPRVRLYISERGSLHEKTAEAMMEEMAVLDGLIRTQHVAVLRLEQL